MERSTGSYPDPTAERAENGSHPFYAPQQRSMESAEDMGNSLAHLQRDLQRDIASDQNDASHGINHHGLPMGPEQTRPQASHPHPQHAPYADSMMTPQATYGHMHPPPPHHQLAAEANMLPSPSAPPQSGEQRKKPKVTRACDECRRKKIRCHFNHELTGVDNTVANDAERCTNCTRTNSTCEFSRQPQKRGPSKGYIKELADRLQSVEQKVGGASDPHLGLSSASPDMRSGDYSRDLPQDPSRKRYRASESHVPEPLSGSSASYGGQDPYSHGTWSSERQNDGSLANPLYSPQGFSNPHYGDVQSDRRDALNQGFSHEGSPVKRRREDSDYSPDIAFYSGEVDNALFDNYMRQIYPTYPILVHSKTALQASLNKVSSAVREAFLRALKVASSQRVLNATASPVDSHAMMDIQSLLLAKSLPGLLQRDVDNKLVALQTSLLVLIYIDTAGPNIIHGGARGAWFGMANDLAYSMKLYQLGGAQDVANLTMDPNGLKAVGQRCWWSLVIIDKWYAAGTASGPRIPDNMIRLGLIDHRILGHSLLNLTRLTLTYGYVAGPICSPFPVDLAYMTNHGDFSNLVKYSLEKDGASILSSDVLKTPIPHLAYWHAKLLFARHMYQAPINIDEMLSYTATICSVIHKTTYRAANEGTHADIGSLGPLAHHAYVLSALTLLEIVKVVEKRDEALKITRDLLVLLEPYRVGEPEALKDRGLCWGNAVVGVLRGVLEKGGDGLQQLANAVVGVEEGEHVKDWAEVGKAGYLNVV